MPPLYNSLMANITELEFDETLDARGLNCPLPILKAKVALNRMAADKILHVQATDPHARIDFESYCARTGHEIMHITETGELLEFYIRRTEAPRNI